MNSNTQSGVESLVGPSGGGMLCARRRRVRRPAMAPSHNISLLRHIQGYVHGYFDSHAHGCAHHAHQVCEGQQIGLEAHRLEDTLGASSLAVTGFEGAVNLAVADDDEEATTLEVMVYVRSMRMPMLMLNTGLCLSHRCCRGRRHLRLGQGSG